MSRRQSLLRNTEMEPKGKDRGVTGFDTAAEMRKTLGQFPDEFMLVEYKGRDHIVAREHYRQVFDFLIPKYFAPRAGK